MDKKLSKFWCFTLNNYNTEDEETIKNSGFKYLVYGREVGGETNTPHLQGYIEFESRKRMSTLKKLHKGIHWETRKGTAEQAAAYCKKEGNVVELGTISDNKQGERNDIEKIKKACRLGLSMRDIMDFCAPKNLRYAEKCLQLFEPGRNAKPHVLWLYGPTGTGKSKKAHEMFAEKDFYRKAKGTKWWDGYDRHKHVIIDDFRDSWWSLTEMLDLLDRYDTRVEYKGGTRQFVAEHIIVTSAFHPKDCYKGTGDKIDQLLRRIDEIICVENTTLRDAQGLDASGVSPHPSGGFAPSGVDCSVTVDRDSVPIPSSGTPSRSSAPFGEEAHGEVFAEQTLGDNIADIGPDDACCARDSNMCTDCALTNSQAQTSTTLATSLTQHKNVVHEVLGNTEPALFNCVHHSWVEKKQYTINKMNVPCEQCYIHWCLLPKPDK